MTHLSPFINSFISLVFIICGIFAVFIMIELRGAPKDRAINANLIKLHKAFKDENGWTRTINEMALLDAPNISAFDIKQAIYFLLTRKNPIKAEDENRPQQTTGKTIMETKYTSCHGSDRTIKDEKTEDGWESTINRMIEHSDDPEYLTEKKHETLLKYLTENQ